MDTRLTRLLPDALGLANGDAVIVKVAGATIVDPYGGAMRSLLVAVLGFTIDVHTGELSACPPAGAGGGGAASR